MVPSGKEYNTCILLRAYDILRSPHPHLYDDDQLGYYYKSTQKVRRILYIIAQSLIQQGMYILLTSIAAQVL